LVAVGLMVFFFSVTGLTGIHGCQTVNRPFLHYCWLLP
jgi:hypothetical protein